MTPKRLRISEDFLLYFAIERPRAPSHSRMSVPSQALEAAFPEAGVNIYTASTQLTGWATQLATRVQAGVLQQILMSSHRITCIHSI